MARRSHNAQPVVGIDIGSSLIKVMVIREREDSDIPEILGVGHAETSGIKQGFVENPTDAARAIRSAITEAEKRVKFTLESAYLSVGGVMLDAVYLHGETTTQSPDQSVQEEDLNNALTQATENSNDLFINLHQLHDIPLRYILDGKEVLGTPYGLHGTRLEVDACFITAITPQLRELKKVVERAGIDVIDVIAAPMASALVALTKKDKRTGCLLIDIGAEVTTILIFEDQKVVGLHVFPMGVSSIVNKIAIACTCSLDEAEQLYRGRHDTGSPHKKIDAVITDTYTEIFTTIKKYFKKIDFSSILPSGVVLIGGGAMHPNAEDRARAILELPVRTAVSPFEARKASHELLMTVYGTAVWGLKTTTDEPGVSIAHKAKQTFTQWIKNFLP